MMSFVERIKVANVDNTQLMTPVDSNAYRQTIGLFATGVTVLATRDDEENIVAMTANAVTSVSLEPLLLLVCINKNAKIMPSIKQSDQFSFSVLADDQEALSQYFANLWPPELKPPPYHFEEWHDGLPRLSRSIAAIACRRWALYDGGDHSIVLGQVTALHRQDKPGNPLIFYNGLYRTLRGLSEDYG